MAEKMDMNGNAGGAAAANQKTAESTNAAAAAATATPNTATSPTANATASASAAAAAAAANPPALPQSFERRLLWEGAFECSLPARFHDIRRFRQVPDHQEVFADAATDQSVVIEINEYQSSVADDKAAKYFLDDLAEVNEAKTNVLLQTAPLSAKDVPNLPTDVYASYAIGEQKVSKYRDDNGAANTVHIYLANFRLKSVASDLLVSFNVPVAFSATSSSAGRSLVNSGTNKHVIATLLSTFKINSLAMFHNPNAAAATAATAAPSTATATAAGAKK